MNRKGQRAVVIGGATGIGAGICRALAQRGAHVHLCDIDEEGAATLAGELGAGAVSVHRCDVTDPENLAETETAIRRQGEPISLLFVNAGAIALRPLVETTPADWQWLFNINVFGTANAIRAFLPGMLAQPERSRIAVTSSVASLRTPPMPGQTMYMASKAAQLGLCNGLRTELDGTGVDLSVIFPGAVRSSLRAKSEAERPGTIQVTVPSNVSSTGYIEPEEAGERILTAIDKGRPFITTHPGERDLVRAMQDRILTAFDD